MSDDLKEELGPLLPNDSKEAFRPDDFNNTIRYAYKELSPDESKIIEDFFDNNTYAREAYQGFLIDLKEKKKEFPTADDYIAYDKRETVKFQKNIENSIANKRLKKTLKSPETPDFIKPLIQGLIDGKDK